MENYKEIARRLKYECDRQEILYSDKRFELDGHSVSNFLNGVAKNPTYKTADKIASVIGFVIKGKIIKKR